MNSADHTYMPPQILTAAVLPVEFTSFLDGTDLLAKTQALRLATVDADGWPHASLLSAGDAVAMPPSHIRFALFPRSSTSANLCRDGRLVLTLSFEGGMHELRMRARPLAEPPADVPLAFFEAELENARVHQAPYAAVTTGVTFALNAPETVLSRWERQVAALRAA